MFIVVFVHIVVNSVIVLLVLQRYRFVFWFLDVKAYDCSEADLVIAIDQSLLTTSDRQSQFDTFVANYKNNNPGVTVTSVQFTSPTNRDGINKVKTTLDSSSARNNGGTKAGRMGLLITGYDSLPDEDKLALDDLYSTGSTNLSIMTTGSIKALGMALEPRDRLTGIKQVNMDQFSYQHDLAQAMLCRQIYTGKFVYFFSYLSIYLSIYLSLCLSINQSIYCFHSQ